MIEINLNNEYKSFPKGVKYSFQGDLILLVGDNGSGKSHFCEIITLENLSGVNNRKSNVIFSDEGISSYEITKDNIIIKNYQVGLSDGASDINFKENVLNILFNYYRSDTSDKNFTNSIEIYKDLLSISDIENIKSGDVSLQEEGREKIKEALNKVNDLYKTWQPNDVFSSQNLATIFREYALKRDNYILSKKKITAEDSESEFLINNPQPWVMLNNLFNDLGFEYRFKSNYKFDDEDFKKNITLFSRNGGKLKYGINDLSSGEKQIFSLVVSAFNLENIKSLNKKILILDEYDATLNPSLIDAYFRIIKKFYLDKGHKVIMTSHSTDTIYGAKKVLDKIPKFYKINKLSDENIDDINKRIEKIDENENTYASIIYKVFGVYSNDLHNELYGYIQTETGLDGESMDGFFVEKDGEYSSSLIAKFDYWKKENNSEQPNYPVTLPTFIRHRIHHPENDNLRNRENFTIEELKTSTDFLLRIKEEIQT